MGRGTKKPRTVVNAAYLELRRGPEGSPNFCFGAYRVPGEVCEMFVQTDWDYPVLARQFGWVLTDIQKCQYCGEVFDIRTPGADEGCAENHVHDCADACDHGSDGTVDCESCGMTTSEFLSAAYDWLVRFDGARVEY